MDGIELIALSGAAAQALSRLVPAQIAASERAARLVQLLARAIAARIAVYARDASGRLSRIDASELEARAKDSELLVKRADAQSAIEALVAEYVGVPLYSAVRETPARRMRSAR